MKKRNIIAILAALAIVLTVFAACGKNEGDDTTNPTVVGSDGQVYEEVTEIVTDAEGNTSVATVTKPVQVQTDAADTTSANATAKPSQSSQATLPTQSSGGSAQTGAPESTTTYEDVTFPEGEKIEVEVESDGRPADCRLDKLLNDSSKNKALYMNCVVVTSTNMGLVETGVNMKVYIKGSKFAMEMPMGVTTMRFAYDGKAMNLILPATKYYYTVADAEGENLMGGSMDMWNSLNSSTMEYVETTEVKIRGNNYICETFTDSTNTNKYYFNKKGELKRIEIIAAGGETSILKINECSTKVDDKIFSVPKGYKQLTEDALAALGGSLGLQ